MKRILVLLILAGLFLIPFAGPGPALAGEAEVVVKYLLKQGILTQEQAFEVMKEISKEKGARDATVRATAEDTARKTVKQESKGVRLPAWVDKMTVKGDLRLRYQEQNTEHDHRSDRKRVRYRLRVGVNAKVNKHWKAGFGVASGGADPRSTNETLDDWFSTKDLRIDYAYAQYQPFKWVKLIGGKFKNPLWRPKDLLWDGDIRPEGGSIVLDYKPFKPLRVWLVGGYWILEEYNGVGDPYMLVVQPGIELKPFKGFCAKFAPDFYWFSGIRANRDVTYSGFGGRTNTTGFDNQGVATLQYDYDSWALNGEIGYTKLPIPFMPYAAVFGQYVKSNAYPDIFARRAMGIGRAISGGQNEGYLYGVKFGHKKVKKLGQWQFKWNYRHLEMDAWPDVLPDSDFYGGRTNAKGHEWEFLLGIHKNVTLGVDFYRVKPIRQHEKFADATQNLIQCDLLLKW